jgi:nitrile hydratase subunit alpha
MAAMTSFDSKKLSHIHHELHTHLPSEPALRTRALESLLTEKKLQFRGRVSVPAQPL